MNPITYQGPRVRLGAVNPDTIAEAFYRWKQDMDYYLPLDSDPPTLYSLRQHRQWEEKWLEKGPSNDSFFFGIHSEEDKLIGFIAIWDIRWNNGECFVSIGIGDPAYRSKGYGSEALNLMLSFCFRQLNLHRVSLIVFDFNERAQRAYSKCGFVYEGRIRGAMERDGQRWSWLVMGILRPEWEERSLNSDNKKDHLI